MVYSTLCMVYGWYVVYTISDTLWTLNAGTFEGFFPPCDPQRHGLAPSPSSAVATGLLWPLRDCHSRPPEACGAPEITQSVTQHGHQRARSRARRKHPSTRGMKGNRHAGQNVCVCDFCSHPLLLEEPPASIVAAPHSRSANGGRPMRALSSSRSLYGPMARNASKRTGTMGSTVRNAPSGNAGLCSTHEAGRHQGTSAWSSGFCSLMECTSTHSGKKTRRSELCKPSVEDNLSRATGSGEGAGVRLFPMSVPSAPLGRMEPLQAWMWGNHPHVYQQLNHEKKDCVHTTSHANNQKQEWGFN